MQTINIGGAPNDGLGEGLRTAFDKINDNFVEARNLSFVNVEDYLANDEDVDGVTDNTQAVARAYAALSSTYGGELYFTPKNWKYNLVVLKSNITIRGSSHYIDGYAGTIDLRSRHIPADITQPVIQVGNDTVYVRGVHIRDCTFYGANTGAMGVYFGGGAVHCKMENSTVGFFTTCIKVQGGTDLPATIIHFTGVHGQPANVANARGWLIVNPANYPVSYTTEINLTGCDWNGPASGSASYLFEIDSCAIKWVNCYFDVSANHGFLFSHNVSTPLPKLEAVNSNFDGGLTTNVVFQGYTNDRILTGLQSFNCKITGSWKDLDGTVIAALPQPIDTILSKSSSTRGTHILLGEDAGSFSVSKIQFRDQVHNYNPDIFAQGASLTFRADATGTLRFADILGNVWAEINTNGAFFYGSNVTASTIASFDANKQLRTATSTGSGTTVVLSDSPTIISPTFTGGTVAPVKINSPVATTIAALQLVDVTGSKAVDIWSQAGNMLLKAPVSGSVRITDSTGATARFQVNEDGTTFCLGAGFTANTSLYLDSNKQLKSLLVTNTAAGTTGARTIDKPLGRVNFAASAQTLVVTNSFVTTASNIQATIKTDDTTAKSVVVSAQSAGSFTLKLNAAATAETAVDFFVINGV
jgi:hypothetical protein